MSDRDDGGPVLEGGQVDQTVGDVVRSLEAARRVLDGAVRGFLKDGPADEINKAVAGIGKAHATVIGELRRIEDARRIEQGGDGLDMAAARAEIERRLDRILAGGEA